MDLKARYEEGKRCFNAGDVDQAIRILEQAMREGSHQTGDMWMVFIMSQLSGCYEATGKAEKALKMARRALELAKSKHGKGDLYLEMLRSLIEIEARCGKGKDALKHSDEQIELCKTLFGTDCQKYGEAVSIRGEVLYTLEVNWV